MTVTRDYEKGTQSIDQKDYALATLERFGMLDSNPVHTPGYGLELSTEQPEKLLGATGIKLYQAIVGSLLYLTQVSRYDMCYAVNQLTRGCSKPAKVHMSAAKHVLRYLKGSADLPIIYKQGHLLPAACLYGCIIRGEPGQPQIDLKLPVLPDGRTNQLRRAQSTVESEMMAVSYGMKEVIYLSNFLGELGFKSFNTVPVNCNSGEQTELGSEPTTGKSEAGRGATLLFT